MSTGSGAFSPLGSMASDEKEPTAAGQPIDSAEDEAAEQVELGQYAAFDTSPGGTADFVELEEREKQLIHEMVILASRTDVASRRFEVEQAWEARLFDRGYQHLLPRRGGGWSLPGETSKWGPLSTADSAALYSTNIYGRDRDIITAAIAREVPKVTFFPQDIDNAADVSGAAAANSFKKIFEKSNQLRERLMELAYYYYTDDRGALYTRYVVDAQRFGVDEAGKPRGSEVTTVYGKLECKVPMNAQTQSAMQFIQLYDELDIVRAKAKYPWIKDKIRPGSTGIGEIELDKIARVNARLALLGSYVTGDAMMRDVTEQYTWFRPEFYFDEFVPEDIRQGFLEKFPAGMLVVFAGQTFAFARNESMDDHLVISHGYPGIGQNRRALGTAEISVQKRLNSYLDIMDDFARKTIPRKHYDAEAFDIEALQAQDNIPGISGPFQRQPGVPTAELVFVEPTPQPQPWLANFTQWFFTDLPASLSGAVPTLFGSPKSSGDEPVGTAIIQRDQALARIGTAWNNAKEAFARAFHQAVICAAANRQGPITDTIPGEGKLSVNPNDLKGNVLCYPEYDAAFPESWSERETRYTELVVGAQANPFYAAMLKSPRNLRAIAQNVRMAELEVPGADSADKQLEEIAVMVTQEPVPNPQHVEMQSRLEQVKAGMAADAASGAPIPPQAGGMLQQAEQQATTIPRMVSSVPVAEDDSENHLVEAEVCFEWMNGPDGRAYKKGTAQQQAAFQNVYLHWQAHEAMAKKSAAENAPQGKPPHISVPMKELPPEGKAQAARKAGIVLPPDAFANKQLVDTQHKIAEKVVPKGVPETFRVVRRAGA